MTRPVALRCGPQQVFGIDPEHPALRCAVEMDDGMTHDPESPVCDGEGCAHECHQALG